MAGICLFVSGKAVMVAMTAFNLAWVHSVEKTQWREDWTLTPDGFVLLSARVRGSGAGMDPGEGAVLKDGWWIWQPDLAPQERIVLAASGATLSGWTLCGETGCRTFGEAPGEPVVIAPCD